MRIAILGTGRVPRPSPPASWAPVTTSSSAHATRQTAAGSPHRRRLDRCRCRRRRSAQRRAGRRHALPATSIGAENLDDTVLWDIANAANPDFSLAIPDDSLGRRIQEAFPHLKVVKAANNVAAVVVADPTTLPAPTTLFLSGDDTGAKEVVSGLLSDLGWPARACSTSAASPTLRAGALPRTVRNDPAQARHALLQHRHRRRRLARPVTPAQATIERVNTDGIRLAPQLAPRTAPSGRERTAHGHPLVRPPVHTARPRRPRRQDPRDPLDHEPGQAPISAPTTR